MQWLSRFHYNEFLCKGHSFVGGPRHFVRAVVGFHFYMLDNSINFITFYTIIFNFLSKCFNLTVNFYNNIYNLVIIIEYIRILNISFEEIYLIF